MKDNKCNSCPKVQKCEDAYRQVGCSKAPSVASKVLIAFVIPIVFFIGSLVVFEPVLSKHVKSQGLLIITNFLLALSVTIVIMFSIKFINKVIKHK